MVWVIWLCEGHTFESLHTAESAAVRLAELYADDLVIGAHTESA